MKPTSLPANRKIVSNFVKRLEITLEVPYTAMTKYSLGFRRI
jgi:hypothetical protein